MLKGKIGTSVGNWSDDGVYKSNGVLYTEDGIFSKVWRLRGTFFVLIF